MKKYGLLGFPLSHSMSPFIHKRLFDISKIEAYYSFYEYSKLDEQNLNTLKELDGFNVTIPYKNQIIDYLDFIQESAKSYQSVNTVANNCGYNTDVYGLSQSIKTLGADLKGKTLILGAGGVARMVAVETALQGGEVALAVRRKSFDKAQNLKELIKKANATAVVHIMDINNIEGDFDLLINCTPVGMYPNEQQCPVPEQVIKKCKRGVFDLIYNPEKTMLMQYAQKNNIPNKGGISMLVRQAAKAHQIWYDAQFSETELNNLENSASIFMKKRFSNNLNNTIAFVGFMASGKTTLAKAVAKRYNLPFVDIDQEIEKQQKMSIPEIFQHKGEEYFRKKETEILDYYLQKQNIIISVGGGAPMQNRELLQQKALVFYIDTPFELCYQRIISDGNRPVADTKTKEQLLELYNKRAVVYEDIMDIKVDGQMKTEQKILTIKEFL